MNSRLVLRQVEIAFSEFHLAIDVDLQPGCIGIFGPSGAGKTTLLELITGLRRAHKGHIALDGDVLADVENRTWIPPHLRRIGYVPQDLALFPHLNVRGNILYGAPPSPTDGGEPSVHSLIEILDLGPLLDRRIAGLSGGEQQRVALARALSAKPRLLLLDEPLTGLDQDRKDNVLEYLRLLRRRWAVSMIYISHQADEMADLCDEILVLREGKLAARGRPEEIFEPASRPAWRLRRTLCVSPEEEHVEGA
ncbi:MAG TPA: ATP-binding cassette domain-containing protein [Candidatus Methylacidiphilales bacterium]|jgi:molybdate transport system ATP-binding protein|nr:ATP-binding cassette domain-containing protein [Candidatus Methylacidiphilales bacterium]